MRVCACLGAWVLLVGRACAQTEDANTKWSRVYFLLMMFSLYTFLAQLVVVVMIIAFDGHFLSYTLTASGPGFMYISVCMVQMRKSKFSMNRTS